MKQLIGGAFLALTLLIAACGNKPDSAQPAKSASEATTHETATKAKLSADDPNVVKIAVPTMQCETCVATITDGVKKVSATQDVNVDLGTKTVFVKVANNTPETQMQLEKAIAGVGYSTTSTPRDPAAYDQLPDCCKEAGMEKK